MGYARYFDKYVRVKMTNWGWYWRVKRKHTPKTLCSQLACIDSFLFFKQKGAISFTVLGGNINLEAKFSDDKFVITGTSNYEILIEQQPCRFGGFCHFFRCPLCKARMRKLYCFHGFFFCRKCLKLGYRSQRLSSCLRYGYMQDKIEARLDKLGGNAWQRPKWMRKHTFERLKRIYWEYDRKHQEAFERETLEIFGFII